MKTTDILKIVTNAIKLSLLQETPVHIPANFAKEKIHAILKVVCDYQNHVSDNKIMYTGSKFLGEGGDSGHWFIFIEQ